MTDTTPTPETPTEFCAWLVSLNALTSGQERAATNLGDVIARADRALRAEAHAPTPHDEREALAQLVKEHSYMYDADCGDYSECFTCKPDGPNRIDGNHEPHSSQHVADAILAAGYGKVTPRVLPTVEDVAQRLMAHTLGRPSGGTATEAFCVCSCGERSAVRGGRRDTAEYRAHVHVAHAVLALFDGPTVAEVAK